MATSPAPDAAAPPGMCPGIATLGAGGSGGDGNGDGSGRGGNGTGRGGNGNGDGTGGDGKSAGSCGGGGSDGGGCPNHHGGAASGKISRGDPVDVVTGRLFTIPELDVALGGPLPLRIERTYSSEARDRNVGLGYGWGHSFAWEVSERRSGDVVLIADDGAEIHFGKIEDATAVVGPHGLVLGRVEGGFVLERVDSTRLIFGDEVPRRGGRSYRLLALEDTSNNRIRLLYRDGKLVEVVDGVGRSVDVVWGGDGNIERFCVADPVSGTRKVTLAKFRYDERGDLIAATNADGATKTFTYDDDHRMTSQTAPTGLVFFYRYDHQGRCVESWGEYPGRKDISLADNVPDFLSDHETRAKGIHHIKLIFSDGGYSEVSDSVTFHRYFGNRFGKCDKAVSSGGVFQRAFDDNGHLLVFIDALGAKTTFERDYRGRELRVTDPLGRTTAIDRYPDGSIHKVINAAGGVTEVTQIENGMIWVDPNGATFSVSYGPSGQVVETIAPNGTRRRFIYDAQGNLAEIVGPGERRSFATYDGWGRCTSIREADGSVTAFEYSVGGRVLAVHEGGATTRYEYDGDGNVTAILDPGGGVTRMVYGGFRKLCETHRPDGAVIRLKYDREGRLVEVHNARGEVHAITYDSFGNRVEERTFDGRELRYRYDAMARLISSTNGSGARTTYERDLVGQLTKRSYADGTETTFEDSALGDVIAAVCPAGRFRFERNAVGWIVGEAQDVAGEVVSVATSYDRMGNPIERKTSLGHTASFSRNALGACDTALLDGTEVVQFAHDAHGRETQRLLAGGGRIDTEYDLFGSLSRRRVYSPIAPGALGAGEPAWVGPVPPMITVDRAYRYTPTRELAEIWDRASGLTRFNYDVLGRLLAVVPESARQELFVYDANGNLFDGADIAARGYDAGGRLVRKGDTEFVWNKAGQLIERRTRRQDGVSVTTTRYSWWETGLLRSVEQDNGTLVEFAYDPWARRVSKRVLKRGQDGRRRLVSSTRFVWDTTHLVHEIKRSAGVDGTLVVEERTYLFEDVRTVPVAHRDARTVSGQRTIRGWFHYLSDDTGAPELLVDSTGKVACALVRSAWGEVTFAPGNVTTTPLRFRGQYADEETGLSYNRYRYYDPAVGRYISTDPIEILGGMNLFAYAGDCPTSAIDVEGLLTMFSVIKDRDGKIVETGFNTDPRTPQGPFNTGKSCAEVAALNNLASRMGNGKTTADVRNKFMSEEYTLETYQIHEDNLNIWQKQEIENQTRSANQVPNNAKAVSPCKKCADMIKGDREKEELSLANQVFANNDRKAGGPMMRWDKRTTWGK